jgi:ornithine cyclodeaminase
MLVLSEDDLRRALPMEQAMDAVAHAFAQLSSGRANVPLRMRVPLPPGEGLALLMPAHLSGATGSEEAAFGVKALTIFPENPARFGLPAIAALVLLLDASTGVPLALLNGGYLTALRTGAASGVATRLLARPDARVLALFGAGAQALPQAWAVCVARPIERVVLVNRTPAHAERLAAALRAFGPPIPPDVRIAADAREALAEADVVCTATASPTPLFADAHLRPGAHLNAIGAFSPDTREIPGATVARARLVVDSREAAGAEAGELILARGEGLLAADAEVAELGEIVLGRAAGRSSLDQITLFKSVGVAVQDVAAAQMAYRRARELGLGVEVTL